jgi:hypothetical protein
MPAHFLLFNPFIRVTKEPICSFPFFGKCWTSSSTRSLSVILSTCPLVNGARVIVYSMPAGSFYELTVSADAASKHDGTLDQQISFLTARTYSNVDIHVGCDLNKIEPRDFDLSVASSSCKAAVAYVDIPECKNALDTLTSCWDSRHCGSSFILLHGPSGCGKTAFVKQFLTQHMIEHEYFDCSSVYAHDGSLFTNAVDSVLRQTQQKQPATPGHDIGAVLVLDRLECMFPPLSPHAQVFAALCSFEIGCDIMSQLHERRQFSFCLATIDKLINGGNVIVVGIASTLANVDQHILHVSGSPQL